jgi:glycosyltransferase involved in cell wall biosynthesis
LNSLVGQTLQEIEILVINDGSTDNTAKIAGEYAEANPRVRVIHQPNGGYGQAMNHGLEMVRGEYVGIVESDDFAEPDMFASLYDLAVKNDAEVVKSDYYDYTASSEQSVPRGIFDHHPALLNQCINPQKAPFLFLLPAAIWSAIYKKSFLDEKHIRFLETPGASYQDISFNFKVWAQATRVVLTDSQLIHYRRDNEASSINSKAKIYCVCDENEEIRRFMDEHQLHTHTDDLAQARVLHDTYLWNINRLAWSYKWEFFRRMAQDFTKYLTPELISGPDSSFTCMEKWFINRLARHPKLSFFFYLLCSYNIIKISGGRAVRVKILGLRVYKKVIN